MTCSSRWSVLVSPPGRILMGAKRCRVGDGAEGLMGAEGFGVVQGRFEGDKEHLLRNPEDPFWKKFAAEASRFQITVDLFSFCPAYTDLASLEAIPKYTCGQVSTLTLSLLQNVPAYDSHYGVSCCFIVKQEASAGGAPPMCDILIVRQSDLATLQILGGQAALSRKSNCIGCHACVQVYYYAGFHAQWDSPKLVKELVRNLTRETGMYSPLFDQWSSGQY